MRRLRGKWSLSLICVIGALVLVSAVLFGQWFHVSGEERTSEGDHVASWELDFGLREYSYFLEVHEEMAKDETNAYSEFNSEDWAAVGAFGMIQILVILALIFVSLTVIMILLIGLGRARRMTGVAVSVLALLLLLGTLVYFSTAFPGALESQGPEIAPAFSSESGFWGSGTFTVEAQGEDIVYETIWGPGWGWYAVLAAFILAVIGTLSLIGARSEEGGNATTDSLADY